MEFIIFVALAVVIVLIQFLFSPTARRINKLQRMISDSTIGVNMLIYLNSDGWNTSTEVSDKSKSMKLIITPEKSRMYNLYLSYKREAPTPKEIKELLYKCTMLNRNNALVELIIDNFLGLKKININDAFIAWLVGLDINKLGHYKVVAKALTEMHKNEISDKQAYEYLDSQFPEHEEKMRFQMYQAMSIQLKMTNVMNSIKK